MTGDLTFEISKKQQFEDNFVPSIQTTINCIGRYFSGFKISQISAPRGSQTLVGGLQREY
jgi:hypothetical protein